MIVLFNPCIPTLVNFTFLQDHCEFKYFCQLIVRFTLKITIRQKGNQKIHHNRAEALIRRSSFSRFSDAARLCSVQRWSLMDTRPQ
jgi:hypothetical protein